MRHHGVMQLLKPVCHCSVKVHLSLLRYRPQISLSIFFLFPLLLPLLPVLFFIYTAACYHCPHFLYHWAHLFSMPNIVNGNHSKENWPHVCVCDPWSSMPSCWCESFSLYFFMMKPFSIICLLRQDKVCGCHRVLIEYIGHF